MIMTENSRNWRKRTHESFRGEWLSSPYCSQHIKEGNEEERQPTAHLPYVANISERIKRVCREFSKGTVLKSGPTLRSLTSNVKDLLPSEKQAVFHVEKSLQ